MLIHVSSRYTCTVHACICTCTYCIGELLMRTKFGKTTQISVWGGQLMNV